MKNQKTEAKRPKTLQFMSTLREPTEKAGKKGEDETKALGRVCYGWTKSVLKHTKSTKHNRGGKKNGERRCKINNILRVISGEKKKKKGKETGELMPEPMDRTELHSEGEKKKKGKPC